MIATAMVRGPQLDLMAFLFGDILAVSRSDIAAAPTQPPTFKECVMKFIKALLFSLFFSCVALAAEPVDINRADAATSGTPPFAVRTKLRSRRRPRWMRERTVPSGTPSAAAICS